MINVNEATKTAYMTDAVSKVITISIPNRNITFVNADLINQSVELTEAIENERNLTFKGCIASQLTFKVADVVTDLRGEYIEAKIQASNTQEVSIFKGYIDAQDNLTQKDVITKFTAYDVLYKVGSTNMESWIDGLTFPMTVKNFRDSLFATLGITQESVTLVNDQQVIAATIKSFLDNPTALKLMQWICELNGRYGQIGRDGKFKYIKLITIAKGLYPSYETFPSDHTYPSKENANGAFGMSLYSDIEYEPYEVDPIDKVMIYDCSGIVEGHYGNGTNTFEIMENPIAFSVTNMMAAAENVYGEVEGKAFIPFVSFKCVGQPWLECGDIIMTGTRKNIVRSYILNRTLRGVQALFDTIESDNDKTRQPATPSEMLSINANKQKILNIQADLVVMNEVIATKATIAELNVTNANVANLTAREASFENATAANFTATNAAIDTLSVREANFETATANNFTATNGRVHDLEADHVTVNDFNAVSGRVTNLEAADVTITGRLTSAEADISTLNTTKLNASEAEITYATIANLDLVSGRVGNLEADHVSTSSITALQGQINTLSANKIDATTVYADFMEVTNWTSSGYIKADKIDANTIQAKISQLSTLSANAFLCNGGGATGNFSVGGNLSCTGTMTTGGNEVATKSWVTANFKPK